MRHLFAKARDEVEHQARQVAQQQGPTPPPSEGRNGRRAAQPASPRQLDYLLSVARRNGNVSPDELLRIAGVEQLQDLTKKQASELIDRFAGNGR